MPSHPRLRQYTQAQLEADALYLEQPQTLQRARRRLGLRKDLKGPLYAYESDVGHGIF